MAKKKKKTPPIKSSSKSGHSKLVEGLKKKPESANSPDPMKKIMDRFPKYDNPSSPIPEYIKQRQRMQYNSKTNKWETPEQKKIREAKEEAAADKAWKKKMAEARLKKGSKRGGGGGKRHTGMEPIPPHWTEYKSIPSKQFVGTQAHKPQKVMMTDYYDKAVEARERLEKNPAYRMGRQLWNVRRAKTMLEEQAAAQEMAKIWDKLSLRERISFRATSPEMSKKITRARMAQIV